MSFAVCPGWMKRLSTIRSRGILVEGGNECGLRGCASEVFIRPEAHPNTSHAADNSKWLSMAFTFGLFAFNPGPGCDMHSHQDTEPAELFCQAVAFGLWISCLQPYLLVGN